MNKWLVVVVLALSVLTSAVGLRATTGGSILVTAGQGGGPMPRGGGK
jgi:hypothetical protein